MFQQYRRRRRRGTKESIRKKDLILIPGSGFSPKRVWLGTNKIGGPQMYQRGKKTTAEKGIVGRATGGYFFSFCSSRGGAKLAPRGQRRFLPPLFSPQSSLSRPLKRGRKEGRGSLGKNTQRLPPSLPPPPHGSGGGGGGCVCAAGRGEGGDGRIDGLGRDTTTMPQVQIFST